MVLGKKSRFPIIFYFSRFLRKYILIFDSSKYLLDPILYQLKVKIEAFVLLQKVLTDTKKTSHMMHINATLHFESKTL